MENIALADPAAHLSIWALFMQAGWVVKLVMIGLLCASIWTWAIIIDKLVAYGRMRLALNRFEQVFWSGQSLEDLYRTLADRKTTGMGAIFVAAMREWKKSFMTSFQAIAASKNTSLSVVAPGIAEALLATAIGLLAAIPAVIAYNKLSSDANKIGMRMEGFADEFSAILSRQIDEKVAQKA
jgi:biopolymer transport protein TolQ